MKLCQKCFNDHSISNGCMGHSITNPREEWSMYSCSGMNCDNTIFNGYFMEIHTNMNGLSLFRKEAMASAPSILKSNCYICRNCYFKN